MLKTRVRVTSCFLWVALTMLGFYSPNPLKAEVQSGVQVTVYNNYWYNNAPPLPTQSGRPVVGTLVQEQVLNYFDQQPLFNMYEDFIVKYEGFITVPQDTEIRFYAPADDGVYFFLNNQMVINDWYDKGGGGSVSEPVQFEAGVSHPFTLWFYENGGGAWVELWWLIDGEWQVIPASAFTQSVVETTTTTEATTTSTTSTTTTTEAPLPPPTTTVVSTTTQPPLVATTSSSSTSTAPPTTTVAPSTTVPPTTTTTILPSTSTTQPEISSTTTIPPITESLSPEEAVAIVTSAEVLQELTSDEATQVFESLEVSELSDDQAEALVEAVQDAPEEVRAAFEEEVNIFDNKFNTYVPLGSNINVGQRKVLVAASGVLFMAPTVSVSSSSTSGSPSDSRKRR